jgi:hypothetical protein
MKWGVYRLDIYHKPGWMLMQSYDNLRDAWIYADMLNTDTNLVHAVFEEDEGDAEFDQPTNG